MKVLAFNLLFIISFFSIFHSVYYYRMKDNIYPELGQAFAPYIDADLMKRIGSFGKIRKKSSFLNYPMKKSNPHKIRIGTFGDSHVYGDEVGLEGDYPSQLQALLGENYEVLNFGMSWYSVSQSFILWQEMHEKFDLDLVIFGPRSQFRYRTLTFNHTEDIHPHYLHSRFIVEADQSVKEIIPHGKNHEERVLNYYGILPSLQYWRYDERAPSILRSYGYYFEKNLRNPFYYFQDTYTENKIINRSLFKTMAKESKDFLFLADIQYLEAEGLTDFLNSSDSVKTLFFEEYLDQGFPFRARYGHSTAIGNALLARVLANKILGKDEMFPNPNFQVNHSLSAIDLPSFVKELVGLPKLSDVRVFINNQTVAQFEKFLSYWSLHNVERGLGLDHYEVLLGFSCDNLSISRSLFLGLNESQLDDFLEILQRDNLPLFYSKEVKNLVFLSMKNCFFSDEDSSISFARDIYHKVLVEELKLLETYDKEKSTGKYHSYRASGDWIKLVVDPDLDPNIIDTTGASDNIITFRFLPKKILDTSQAQ